MGITGKYALWDGVFHIRCECVAAITVCVEFARDATDAWLPLSAG